MGAADAGRFASYKYVRYFSSVCNKSFILLLLLAPLSTMHRSLLLVSLALWFNGSLALDAKRQAPNATWSGRKSPRHYCPIATDTPFYKLWLMAEALGRAPLRKQRQSLQR
jgi:hypothetical protein